MGGRLSTLSWASLLALVMLLTVGCTGTDRPSTSDWELTWSTAAESLPRLEELGDSSAGDRCGHALGQLRAIQPELIPTPDPALDAVVNEWMRVAEDAMFECRPSSTGVPGLGAAYDELTRLKAEVDVVLELDFAGG